MKILICSINYHPELTGVGKYTEEMANWLCKKGHEVQVVTAPPFYPDWKVADGYNSWVYKKEVKNNVTVWRCPLWVPSNPRGVKRILHLLSFAITSFPVMLGRVIWKPSVVIAIEPPFFCTPASLLVSFLAGSRSVLHVQDFEIDAAFDLGMIPFEKLRNAVAFLERIIMNRFDKVSTISFRMLDRLALKGVEGGKQLYFPNWVNTNEIYPLERVSTLKAECGFQNGDIIVLYSGNMGEKQGLELIIEVARSLEGLEPLKFVMCGSGVAYDRLKRKSKALKNMYWMPLQPYDKLNELLNLADIHLLPQLKNAADLVMPSKLTGIMASGRPVVATAEEGTEVWIVVKDRGVVTEPGDQHAFVKAIKKLFDDVSERNRLGCNARDYAVKNLGYVGILDRFEAELRLLAQGK